MHSRPGRGGRYRFEENRTSTQIPTDGIRIVEIGRNPLSIHATAGNSHATGVFFCGFNVAYDSHLTSLRLPLKWFVHHRLARTAIAFSLILTLGGHWFILQSVAWVGMFAKYSQSDSVAQALVKTFDGKHPCKLCLAVQQGKKSESRRDSVKVETMLDLLLQDRPAASPWHDFGSFELSSISPPLGSLRFERPPTPPPRSA